MLSHLRLTVRQAWRSLVLADVLSKIVTYVLLAPLVALIFRLFLALSGRSILADVDIARFLLHPLGLAAFVVVVGAGIAIVAIEQAMIIATALGTARNETPGVIATLIFVMRRAPSVFRLTSRVAAAALLTAAPFLIAGGTVYFALLTEHDINFYLTQKPPRLWIAFALAGAILAVLGGVLLRLAVGWSLALPFVLFENVSPRQALAESRERTRGHRWRIAGWMAGSLFVSWIVSTALSVLIFWFASLALPRAEASVWVLASAIGGVLTVWLLASSMGSLIANVSFGLILAGAYRQLADAEAVPLPAPLDSTIRLRLTRGRIVAMTCVAMLVATLIGATTLHSIHLEDRVQITAHRGGARYAPENTLAAIRRAIDDGTDWVEIDVQESKDGEVVVVHDSDLKKVGGSPLKIWEATAEELRAVDIGSHLDPRFQHERVPTLAEVLEACKGRTKVNIELKYYGHDQQLEQKVVDLVEAHRMQTDVVVMSLKAAGIQKIKQLRPEWRTGLLVAVAAGDPSRADADFVAVNTGIATPKFVKRAHGRGKDVYVWTINDAATMSAMISRGVDNIITDDPALARSVLAERAAMSPIERVLVEIALLVRR